MKRHINEHRKCPRKGCRWAQATDGKHRSRHVWTKHRIWATEIRYPVIGGSCVICGKTFRRVDYVVRHVREAHEGKKRKIKENG
ncbi:hypothetical protein EV126DRAFT_173484 [Verticillium dahliae]|nr:hypothetical protein EV126DRAFT_173484 [Verticillium dahliae]